MLKQMKIRKYFRSVALRTSTNPQNCNQSFVTLLTLGENFMKIRGSEFENTRLHSCMPL